LQRFCKIFAKTKTTVARWPNFRPNNSRGPKKFSIAGNGIILQKLAEVAKKEVRKYFYNYLDEKPYNYL
jgi:hypothetical protein